MTLLLLASLVAAAAGLAVIYPILSRRGALVRDVTAGGILDAEARRRVALVELKEIEYDYLGGKLDEADYRELRERLSREALAAIRAVDAVQQREHTVGSAAESPASHACGFANPPGSRFCGGCGDALR